MDHVEDIGDTFLFGLDLQTELKIRCIFSRYNEVQNHLSQSGKRKNGSKISLKLN